MYQDRGHYYLNGVLDESLTKAKCRDNGGIPSVTTKIDSWTDSGLVFWKIGENIEAAYNIIDRGIGITLEEFRKVVAQEYYNTHNEIFLGTFIHDILDKLIKNAIEPRLFMSYFKQYADPQIADLFESVQIAYEWFKENVKQAVSEKILYNEELGISGMCDLDGLIIDKEGAEIIGGVDWKCSFAKKHPGYLKSTGVMKSLGFKKQLDYKLQLGAYGRLLNWKGAWIVKISTNPLVPGIHPLWYSQEDLLEGYKIYRHIARAYDLINGYVK